MKKPICSIIAGLVLTLSIIYSNSLGVYAAIKGDFNSDGVIDNKDLAVLKTKILLQSIDVAYDINGDTKINILDYVALSKMFVKTPITDNTNITSAFKDVNFKNEVYALIGKNGPVPILYSDVKNLKNLNISSKNISSLSGLEYFTSLTSLYCISNKLTSLDITKNIALTTLACDLNKLTKLDASKNIALNYLACGSNQLTTLDLSKNSALIYLDCQRNTLTNLNVNNNIKLTYLSCAYNKLTTLDVSKNIALTYLNCKNNSLTSLDVIKNTALTYLNCSYNNITTLFSIKNTWYQGYYKTQYADASHTATINSLIITVPVDDNTDITSKFTDTNFKTAVYALIGKASTTPILYSDVKKLSKLNINSKNITSLNGIEYFTALTYLDCTSNTISILDTSKNTALTTLYCYYNQLTTLDLTKNVALIYLGCGNNKLSSLDVSKNAALIDLYCPQNQLTTLDVTKNTVLDYLSFSKNKIASLDVTKNAVLTHLDCYSNQLTTLDVSKNTILTFLDCRYNQLTTLCSFADNYYNPQYTDSSNTTTTNSLVITTPDSKDITSKFTDVNFKNAVYDLVGKTIPAPIIYSDVKNLTRLDLPSKNIASLSGIEYFTALTYLDCTSNTLAILDVSKNAALTYLGCFNNQLTTLDVTKNTALTFLGFGDNKLTTIDISKNTALNFLYCYNNQLSTLDVSKNTALIYLDCYNNQLTTLEITKNIDLKFLDCRYNQLTILYSIITTWANNYYNPQYTDATHTTITNSLIITVPVTDNTDITSKFTDVNFKNVVYALIGKTNQDPIIYSDVKNLARLDLSSKNIANLSGIEYFTALTYLSCDSNNLKTLDTSKNISLTDLYCQSNQLTTLDISKNTALAHLYCLNNQLTTLDVSNNNALTYLNCFNNQLVTLDISKNIALTGLYCWSNQLTTLDISKNTALTDLNCQYNQLTTLYSVKNTWSTSTYKTQYTDETHNDTRDTLVITIKN